MKDELTSVSVVIWGRAFKITCKNSEKDTVKLIGNQISKKFDMLKIDRTNKIENVLLIMLIDAMNELNKYKPEQENLIEKEISEGELQKAIESLKVAIKLLVE